ncbi:MAG: DUF4956 domain-containing protein [Planctomycetota bacterium]
MRREPMPPETSNPFSLTISADQGYALFGIALQLGVAFLCGCAIACIYRLVRPRHKLLPSFPATLVLLTILCALLPLVIGQNVAWAFGLVGALSIVRFRTAIDDTHDIAFVIFAVLIGMAVGASNLEVAVTGIAVIGAAALLVRPGRSIPAWASSESKLVLRVAAETDIASVDPASMPDLFLNTDLTSIATGKQGATIEMIYRVRLAASADPAALIQHFNSINGVQSVLLRR